MRSLRKMFQQTFEGHKGRPGKVGGSTASGQAGSRGKSARDYAPTFADTGRQDRARQVRGMILRQLDDPGFRKARTGERNASRALILGNETMNYGPRAVLDAVGYKGKAPPGLTPRMATYEYRDKSFEFGKWLDKQDLQL